jgi:hypothetical protein
MGPRDRDNPPGGGAGFGRVQFVRNDLAANSPGEWNSGGREVSCAVGSLPHGSQRGEVWLGLRSSLQTQR